MTWQTGVVVPVLHLIASTVGFLFCNSSMYFVFHILKVLSHCQCPTACLEYLPDLHICAARRLPGSVILCARATDRSEQADTFLLALLIVSCFSLLDKGLLGTGRDLDLAKYFQQRHVAMYNCNVALCIILPLYTTGDFCLTKITSHGNNGIHWLKGANSIHWHVHVIRATSHHAQPRAPTLHLNGNF